MDKCNQKCELFMSKRATNCTNFKTFLEFVKSAGTAAIFFELRPSERFHLDKIYYIHDDFISIVNERVG
jgi:hypothetical protein